MDSKTRAMLQGHKNTFSTAVSVMNVFLADPEKLCSPARLAKALMAVDIGNTIMSVELKKTIFSLMELDDE